MLLAAKYKEYNKIRDILSGKIPPNLQSSSQQTPRKRKHQEETTQIVSKRQQTDQPQQTPTNSSLRPKPWEIDPYDSPSLVRKLFTPSKKVIGPTPQKDGVVMGLFDLLQEDGTPSKPNDQAGGAKKSMKATPRKTTGGSSSNPTTTPATGKRFKNFETPLKSLNWNVQGSKTPSSISKLHFSTPSFLRRDSQRPQMPTVNEHGANVELSPQMVRVPKKPLVRGLSSMLASLRKMEEDAADDDLDALREMENEVAGGVKAGPKKVLALPPVLEKEEAQSGLPLGGFDDEAMYDSEPEEPELGRDGQPLKVYKKKGQKRTTRRVNMKPQPMRAKATRPEAAGPGDDSDNDAPTVDETVPETQMDEMASFGEARNFDSDSQSEYTASEGGTRYRRPNQSRKNRGVNKDGKIKTEARKVNALAHQNFKRLKLRNSGAKGGAAHNSRFRRKK
jgi:DNA replication regulator SLD2